MSGLIVFGQIRDRALQKVSQESTTDQGHCLRLFDTCEEVIDSIRKKQIPDFLLLEYSTLNQFEERQYVALLQSQPRINACLVRRPSETPWRELEALANVNVFSMPVLRSDLERLMESKSITRVGTSAGTAPLDNKPNADSLRSRDQIRVLSEPILEELGNHRFFFALAPAMLRIYREVKLLEGLDVPILILGESGTGKEIIAHLIHKHSRRAPRDFVNVNCAALPMDLLESELFGHVKGAFTGAINDRPGWFEQANGGTILLDEIGEISAPMQAKLLHVLQDGQFTRLGGRQPTRVDAHVLAATNISIEQALADKTFREDLYYRLNTFTINVPPLRERTMEIPYLVREMIARAPLDQMRPIKEFSRELMEMLPLYNWPGNLRELGNFVIRTLIMEDEGPSKMELESKIQSCGRMHHPEPVNSLLETGPMRSVVQEIRYRTESRMIEDALLSCRWNRRDAARSLNISYRGLLYKIQQYGLSPKMQRLIN